MIRPDELDVDGVVDGLAEDDRPAARRGRLPAVVVVAAVSGIVLRLAVARSALGRREDNDEAVAGLIAIHIARGEWHPFYWGQSYGGTLELVLTAGVFRVAGVGVWALRLVPALLCAGSAVLVWRIGQRTVGDRAAVVAASIWWVFPAGFVWWSTKASGFYWVGSCATLGSVLLALRQWERPSRRGMLALGVVVGLGWWTTPLSGFVTGPVCVWLLLRQPGVRRFLAAGMAGTAVGALPWIVANVTHGFPSLGQPVSPVATTYLQRLSDCVTIALPRLLGLRAVRGDGWLLGPVGILLYAALVVAFLALVRRWPRRLEVVLVVVACFPVLYAFPTSTATSHPRYSLFVAPLVALLIGAGVERLVRRSSVGLVAVVGSLAAVTALALGALAHDGRAEPDVVPVDDRAVIDTLDRLGIDRAYTDHWIGYRLTFETGERILTDPVPYTRWPPYDREVARSGRVAWILPDGGPLDRRFSALVTVFGTTAHRIDAGAYVIYTTDAPVTPVDLGLDP